MSKERSGLRMTDREAVYFHEQGAQRIANVLSFSTYILLFSA